MFTDIRSIPGSIDPSVADFDSSPVRVPHAHAYAQTRSPKIIRARVTRLSSRVHNRFWSTLQAPTFWPRDDSSFDRVLSLEEDTISTGGRSTFTAGLFSDVIPAHRASTETKTLRWDNRSGHSLAASVLLGRREAMSWRGRWTSEICATMRGRWLRWHWPRLAPKKASSTRRAPIEVKVSVITNPPIAFILSCLIELICSSRSSVAHDLSCISRIQVSMVSPMWQPSLLLQSGRRGIVEGELGRRLASPTIYFFPTSHCQVLVCRHEVKQSIHAQKMNNKGFVSLELNRWRAPEPLAARDDAVVCYNLS